MSTAAQQAIAQLSMDGLRDRLVFVDPTYYYYDYAATPQE